mmetsp:Transcript_1037/g.3044  ORF Transcript_1037/g.3044 Transcript_1037/m.3044 type:complete len:769 (-) Transcript_1037:724-3030(-)
MSRRRAAKPVSYKDDSGSDVEEESSDEEVSMAELKSTAKKGRAQRKRTSRKVKEESESEADAAEAAEEEDDDSEGDGAGDDGDEDDFEAEAPAAKRKRTSRTTSKATKRASPARKKAAPKKAAAKKETSKRAVKRTSSTSSKASSVKKESAPKVRPTKKLTFTQQLENVMRAFKWWEAEELPEGQQWRTLRHNGVLFPPNYEPHGVKLLYDGKPVDLTKEQEEVATFYALVAPDGPQLGDPTLAPIFNKNFFDCFKEVLGTDHVIKEFDKCDFSLIREHLEQEREARRNRSKEEKVEEKLAKEEEMRMYQFALVDGNLQKVGNVMVEPPGLFRGRGKHPKMGTVKKRVMPEEISINVDRDGVPPRCPVPGHSWGEIVFKSDVTWLAYWQENVMCGTKYVFLSAGSGFKGRADRAKYEKARMLCRYIDKIRRDYVRNLYEREASVAQLATAMWVIDKLALRVGNEKDDDEADTVGCCSLRVEHIKFPDDHSIELDFLGKDSMRHHQVVDLGVYGEVGMQVLKNLQRFSKGKDKTADVFDELTVDMLNKHLSSLMPGLSAKVFRTYNASVTLEQQLRLRVEEIEAAVTSTEQKLVYDGANREVAILCNHQRTVSKGLKASMEKLGDRLELLQSQLEELEQMLTKVRKGKSIRVKPKADPKEEEAMSKEDLREKRMQEAHLFARQPSVSQLEKKIEMWKRKMDNLAVQLRHKDENKAVALGTSKINYMDPRISVAFCKRHDVPVERVFPATLRDKFSWAMTVPSTWKFDPR